MLDIVLGLGYIPVVPVDEPGCKDSGLGYAVLSALGIRPSCVSQILSTWEIFTYLRKESQIFKI